MDITIDLGNIGKAIKELEDYKKSFESNVTKLVTELTDLGEQQATQNFKSAQYDGTNDVQVSSRVYKKVGRVMAKGKATLFIEFGTGVTYGSNHPEAHMFGYRPGSYGPNGLKTTWAYYGEEGTNGVVRRETDKGKLVTTHGNPANRCLYDAGKTIEMLAPKIARGIFK